MFIPPGGHVEYLETIEQACIREMPENANLKI
jgi:ADP-ribose pyrophosphatase YjhB (NUDIX family)